MAQQQQQAQGPPLGPSDTPALFDVLNGALSNDTATRKQAEATLAPMEWRQGFCSCLLEIVSAKSAEHSARWLASVQLKNTIDRQWRPRRNTGGLSAEEKQHIRGKLMENIGQENNQIAVQIAVIFAKIARHDYPREWPSLFSDLMGRLNGGDLLLQRRVYLVFHHALKELSSKRLPADQRTFAQVTSQLIDHVWSNWCSDAQVLLSGLPGALAGQMDPTAERTLLLHFERWLILLKALRRLLLFGFTNDCKSAEPCQGVMQVLQPLLQALQALLPMRPQPAGSLNKPLAMLDRGLLKLVKTVMDLQAAHPWAFHKSEMLVPSASFFCDHLTTVRPGASGSLPERFNIRCILFMHAVVTCSVYKAPASSLSSFTPNAQEAQKAMSTEVAQVLGTFWSTGNRLQSLTTCLIQWFFPLTTSQLREWQNNPEGFVAENACGAWQEQLRGSAETLMLDLLGAHRETLAPTLVEMLQQANSACPPGILASIPVGQDVSAVQPQILLKEAVYNAIGVGSYDLYEYIQFEQWFSTVLVAEVADPHPLAKPLRRRAILMLGCWVTKLGDKRSTAYQMLEAGLADEDMVIKLAAVETLHNLLDDWDFREEPFLPHVPAVMQHLANLLCECAESETELKVFGLLSLIIERLGESLKPYLQGVLSLLPHVWHQSETNSLLRIQLMVSLQHLLNTLGPESPSAYSVVLPILSIATDVTQRDELNLMEDGLALWLVTLRNATQPVPELLSIFPNLQAVMARSTEHIRIACQIIVSAVLLGGPSFLAEHGGTVVAIITNAVGAINDRGLLLLIPAIETILISYPEEAPASLETALAGLLAQLMGGTDNTMVHAAVCGLFARTLLAKPAEWGSRFARYAVHFPVPAEAQGLAATQGEQLMLCFLDKWLAQIDCISQPLARKLSGLALCQLLTVQHVGVLQRLDSVAAAVTGIWHEVEGGADDGSHTIYGSDYHSTVSNGGVGDLGGDFGGGGGSAEATEASENAEGETVRRSALRAADPVHRLTISGKLRSGLDAAASIHGENFTKATQMLDPTLQQQLQVVLSAAAPPGHQHQHQ